MLMISDMDNISCLDYAKHLHNVKRALLKKGLKDLDVLCLEILISKLIEMDDSPENPSSIYSLRNIQDFSQVLKYERLSRQFMQKDFARILNIDKANYCKLEKGRLNISLSKFFDICDKLNLTVKIQGLPF